MECRKCKSQTIVKNGKSKLGIQRFYCKNCHHSFPEDYHYGSCRVSNEQIILLLKESCGIRGIGRILEISPNTVIRRILKIARTAKRSAPISLGQSYQVDELFTYVGNKNNRFCIAYSFNPENKEVIDLVVGRRNKTNLTKIISTLLLADAKRIVTDKLNIYEELIPKEIHSTKNRGINHIERQNLTLRTHLKRLNRRTICYSKSLAMLLAVVKIYCWR
ncbi:IS1 transposase [compost metagenome]